MKKNIFGLIFLSLLLISFSLSAKKISNKVKRKANVYFEEAKYFIELGKVNTALEKLHEALKISPNFTQAQVLELKIYTEYIKDYKQAIKTGLNIANKSTDFPSSVYYYLGDAYFFSDEFDVAKTYFHRYRELSPRSSFANRAALMIKNCAFAKQAITHPLDIEIKPLPYPINTPDDEYFPTLTADGSQLFFTYSSRGEQGQEDIYVSAKTDTGWGKARKLEKSINSSRYNEGAHSISPDGKFLIFTACNRPDRIGSCDLYLSRKQESVWQKPVNLGRPINSRYWEGQASISADGKSLYFASDRKGGKGKSDIYVSHIDSTGNFGIPINLGTPINTNETEENPFIHPDNQTLYFVSNGHVGMGNSDIYRAERSQGDTWKNIKNLGYPINSKQDEEGIFIQTDGSLALISKTNKQTASQDIYTFVPPVDIRPFSTKYIKGYVQDAQTGKRLKASIKLIDTEKAEETYRTSTDSVNGAFLFTTYAGKHFACHVSKPGYLFHSEHFSLSSDETSIKKLVIKLQPIDKDKVVILKNIFFDIGLSTLKPSSYTELDKLVGFLDKNQTLYVEIGGHTDHTGQANKNLLLSNDRAKAVRDYLVSKGIDKKRLTYVGYGADRPISDNQSEWGRMQNRRVEMKIIK